MSTEGRTGPTPRRPAAPGSCARCRARRPRLPAVVDYVFGGDAGWGATITVAGQAQSHVHAGSGLEAVREVAAQLAGCARAAAARLVVEHRLEGDPRAFRVVAACDGFLDEIPTTAAPRCPIPRARPDSVRHPGRHRFPAAGRVAW
jgi:hypothetical protein